MMDISLYEPAEDMDVSPHELAQEPINWVVDVESDEHEQSERRVFRLLFLDGMAGVMVLSNGKNIYALYTWDPEGLLPPETRRYDNWPEAEAQARAHRAALKYRKLHEAQKPAQ